MTTRFKALVLVLLFLLAALAIGNSRLFPFSIIKQISQNNHPEAITQAKTTQLVSPTDSVDTTQAVKIIIDPGHGGKDSGADKGHVIESEVTLDISKNLMSCLEDKSYEVELTRASNVSLYTLSNIEGTMQKKELDARTNIINNSGSNMFICIHINSFPKDSSVSGSIVYYNPLKPESAKLANCIQEQLNNIKIADFKRDSHDPQEANYFMLKNTTIPGVLIETAFITNLTERNLLKQESFKEQLAAGVATGIENYLQLK